MPIFIIMMSSYILLAVLWSEEINWITVKWTLGECVFILLTANCSAIHFFANLMSRFYGSEAVN